MWSKFKRNVCHKDKKSLQGFNKEEINRKNLQCIFKDIGGRYTRRMFKKLEEEIKNISLNISYNLFANKNVEYIVTFFRVEIQDM